MRRSANRFAQHSAAGVDVVRARPCGKHGVSEKTADGQNLCALGHKESVRAAIKVLRGATPDLTRFARPKR